MDSHPVDIVLVDSLPVDSHPVDIVLVDILPVVSHPVDIVLVDIVPVDILTVDIITVDILTVDIRTDLMSTSVEVYGSDRGGVRPIRTIIHITIHTITRTIRHHLQ